ncbi:Hypothetical predicted protein [Pelobates cultripes]|uniref:Uncharacterized protein n=1 Tax=Pelobates cultripes TaxID=61616 RepID=A0AAD1QYE5_PELCU|nr:Hypothetical predicted protein [Pelobates cultripes]
MGSGINLSKKAQKTAKKSAIPTTTNRERPQHTPAHLGCRQEAHHKVDEQRRARQAYTRQSIRPRQRHAAGRHREAQPRNISAGETLHRWFPLHTRPGARPCPPPPAGGGYPGRMAVTYATAGIPAWGVRWPPTLAKAACEAASQQKLSLTWRERRARVWRHTDPE